MGEQDLSLRRGDTLVVARIDEARQLLTRLPICPPHGIPNSASNATTGGAGDFMAKTP